MATTGNKQAYIAYKASTIDGAPLDIDNELTSISGRKQAIALLVGRDNPDPGLYEVEFYFSPDAIIGGNPTVIYSPDECAVNSIIAAPATLLFYPGSLSQDFIIRSKSAWVLDEVPPALTGVFTFSASAGAAGTSTVTVTTDDAAALGQGYIYFRNTITNERARIYFIHVSDITVWILDTGEWNNLGFWLNGSIWNN